MSIQFAGGTIVNTTFTPGTKAVLQADVVTELVNAGWTQLTGPPGGGAQTVTMTIASPGVISLTAHGLLANDQVVFSTTGALPTGLTAGTVYYVKTVLTSGTFTVSSSAGGSVINTSGSQSGTQTMVGRVRVQSATSPANISMIINMADNGGTCITFSIEDGAQVTAGGNSTSDGCGFLNPAAGSGTFQIIADKYQAFIFLPTSTARGFVAFGTPYIPSFLSGVTQCCWGVGNAVQDTDTTVRASFQTVLRMGNDLCQYQGIVNTSLIDYPLGNSGSGSPMICSPLLAGNGIASGQIGTNWGDGSALMQEPLIAWASTSYTGQALIRGQLWDSVVICLDFAANTTTSFDSSHTWQGLTGNNTNEYATLFIATA